MFERYTERARRVIFFARYEASQYGSPYIESEHLLLGVARENKALIRTVLPNLESPGKTIRAEIEAVTGPRPRISTSVEMPLSQECKHILNFASEEADRLGQKQVASDHLLLGILCEEKCTAARILTEHGASLEELRQKIADHPSDRTWEAKQIPGEDESTSGRSHTLIGVALEQFLSAWARRDSKAVAELFATHGQLWDVRGDLWHAHAQIEKGIAAHFNSVKPTQAPPDVAPDVRDIKMVTANVAIVTLVGGLKGAADQPTSAIRVTLIFREDTQWRIVSAHLATVPPGA